MRTRYITTFPVKYRLKQVYLYFLLALVLAAGMCTVAVMTDGASTLWTRCWGWYLLVFLAWQVLVHPHVVLNETRIEIINPFRTHMIDYAAIERIDAQSFLSVSHGHKKYQAWGAPIATQVMSERHRNIMADATLPSARYAGHALTAVDLTASGLAGDIARQLAGHIVDLDAAGLLSSNTATIRTRWNAVATVVALILFGVTAMSWLM